MKKAVEARERSDALLREANEKSARLSLDLESTRAELSRHKKLNTMALREREKEVRTRTPNPRLLKYLDYYITFPPLITKLKRRNARKLLQKYNLLKTAQLSHSPDNKTQTTMALRERDAEISALGESGRAAQSQVAQLVEQVSSLERALEVATLAARDDERSRADAAIAEHGATSHRLESQLAETASVLTAAVAARDEAMSSLADARAAALEAEAAAASRRAMERATNESLETQR